MVLINYGLFTDSVNLCAACVCMYGGDYKLQQKRTFNNGSHSYEMFEISHQMADCCSTLIRHGSIIVMLYRNSGHEAGNLLLEIMRHYNPKIFLNIHSQSISRRPRTYPGIGQKGILLTRVTNYTYTLCMMEYF